MKRTTFLIILLVSVASLAWTAAPGDSEGLRGVESRPPNIVVGAKVGWLEFGDKANRFRGWEVKDISRWPWIELGTDDKSSKWVNMAVVAACEF